MYADPRLDTPPPQSSFRRPWSPDPYQPLPSTRASHHPDHRLSSLESHSQQPYDPYRPYDSYNRQNSFNGDQLHFPDQHQPHNNFGRNHQGWRREPSDVSVEALDLADYAMTLRSNQRPTHQPYDMYPPSPPPVRPLAHRDSFNAPSLTTGEETLSSQSYATASRARNPSRRPFSLPPPSASRSTRNSRTHYSPSQQSHHSSRPETSPRIHDPEIDISTFPAWSRNWYSSGLNHSATSAPDIYTALPTSRLDLKRSPFDPGHSLHNGYAFPDSSGFSDPYGYAPPSFHDHDSDRDLLPWSNEPPEYGPPIDASLKEERLRMLEREFGPNAKVRASGGGGKEADFVDESGKPLIGTVDAKGHLVTKGPKKRTATRVLQILLSLAAAIPSIYAALVSPVSNIIYMLYS